MTPFDYYQDQCKKGFITEDPQQLAALKQLQRVYDELIQENQKQNIFLSLLRKQKSIKGLYLWGSVGIGKTFLMDCFFHTLPFKKKLRMHFYQFMQMIHNQLKKYQGKKDPLKIIAKELADDAHVLCFDELFVSDIADAMLLGRLFRALFSQGVCLVTTSNVAPDDLYKNGLQRINFLPAIAAIKENMQVLHIPTKMDYRLRHLQEAGVFYSPLNKESQQKIEKSFETLTHGYKVDEEAIVIHDRVIPIKKKAGDVVWFDFAEICKVPRSQKDYLAIAELYQAVFISDVPAISEDEKDTICLFISLVDVFYDARVRLVISSAEPVSQIYSRGFMVMEYTRTHSRLLEMQSVDYFSGEEK